MLWLTAQMRGFTSNRWITYRQAQELGGQVRKGEKGTTAVFYKRIERKTGELDANGEEQVETIPIARAFTVFNLDQIDGIDAARPTLGGGFEPRAAAEALLQASGVTIHHGGARAFYRPRTDEITLPDRERFERAADYYATALHELTHATAHPSRCARETRSYAFEELVAGQHPLRMLHVERE